MTSIYGPIITAPDIEDAVRGTLQRWLDTMLGEVERQSNGRWATRGILRPKSWEFVTDYKAPNAERRLPCIAVEAGPERRTYTGDGMVNTQLGLDVFVLAKGPQRGQTRDVLAGLVQGVLMVLEMHSELDGFADGTVIGEITRDAMPAEKTKTAAGARIPITVLVSDVGARWGGPEEPDDPPPTPLPPTSPEYPAHTETNVAVTYQPMEG